MSTVNNGQKKLNFLVKSVIYLYFCRAKDFCAELKTEIDHVEEQKVEWTNDGLQRLRPSDFPIGQFPGYRDTGSPLIIESRGTDRMTIIGMFREQLNENGKFSSFMKMSLLSKIHPDAWNWIVNCADWTEDDQAHSMRNHTAVRKQDFFSKLVFLTKKFTRIFIHNHLMMGQCMVKLVSHFK